jgi:hypothetical protein
MAFYSGCILLVKIPPNYPKGAELIELLRSKYEGCEVKVEETTVEENAMDNNPYVVEAWASENAQLSSLQTDKDWVPLGTPAAMEAISAQFLIRAATETIEEFVRDLK